jgi:hypothetical protein
MEADAMKDTQPEAAPATPATPADISAGPNSDAFGATTLAATGSSPPFPAIGSVFLLVMVGGMILATRRRHNRTQNKVS